MASIKQHLIDPEVCIRCNTCESVCPRGAVSHDHQNYVVDAARCDWCRACIDPCPTGSIDHYRWVPADNVYSVATQLRWTALPTPEALAAQPAPSIAPGHSASSALMTAVARPVPLWRGPVRRAPLSAPSPPPVQFGPKAAQPWLAAEVLRNTRMAAAPDGLGRNDIHHLLLRLPAGDAMRWVEGQAVGVLPPEAAIQAGQPAPARLYSIASPRDGETAGQPLLSLLVKRVVETREGVSHHGLLSTHLAQAQAGDTLRLTGPFGLHALMPDDPAAPLLLIGAGTGLAPLRAMLMRRQRQRLAGQAAGQVLLLLGMRTPAETPWLADLQMAQKPGQIQLAVAYSRQAGLPRQHVQDLMRSRAALIAPWLAHPATHVHICGPQALEAGVAGALHDIAAQSQLDWTALVAAWHAEGRLQLDTW